MRAARIRALGFAVAVGGCAFSVDGELPEIEVRQLDIRLPAVPGEGDQTVSVPLFVKAQERVGLAREAYESVKVREVVITAKNGVNDLAFVRALRMTMNGVEGHLGGAAPVQMVRYERSPGADVGATLAMPSVPPAEVVEPWRSSINVIVIEVTGDLPAEAWTVDVVARFSATLAF